jgi:hypothetical protein
VTTSAPTRPATATPASLVFVWHHRGRSFLRLACTEHRAVTALVLLGAALRIAVMIGYQPALWFHGDSGVYLRQSTRLVPPIDPFRPVGYTLFLKALGPTQTLFSVVALQHLMGLAIAVVVYIFLQRRGLPRWLSCLAVVAPLFDSLQVTMEHFILVETLFTAILLACFLLLLWHRIPTTVACAIAGLLFFGAWLTKPLAMPLFPIVVGYLLLRRVGWRRVTGFAVAFLIPYFIVQALVSGHISVYGSNSSALYGRAASIADCDRLPTLTAAERLLCPGPGQRNMRPDWYIWADPAPGAKYRGDVSAYPAMRGFAIAVLLAQPGDYLRQVGKEVAAHFVPGVDLGWSYGCLRERTSLPDTARDTKPIGQQCHPQLASADFKDVKHPPETNPLATPLTKALHGYAVAVRTSPVVVSIALLLTAFAYVIRRRGQRRWLAQDAGLLMASGLALIILPVVVGMYEARYALPALPLICIAGALATHCLLPSRASRGPRAPHM